MSRNQQSKEDCIKVVVRARPTGSLGSVTLESKLDDSSAVGGTGLAAVSVFVKEDPRTFPAQDSSSATSTLSDYYGRVSDTESGNLGDGNGTLQKFRFDGVLPVNATQQMVYNAAGCKGMVSRLFKGYNGTVLCFGQTGAGKTHTMTGPDGGTRHDYEHRGILPRVLSEVFEAVSLIPEDAKIRLSYVEIYNEQLVDLLSDPRGLGESCNSKKGKGKKQEQSPLDLPVLSVAEDRFGQVMVRNASYPLVNTVEEAVSVYFDGQTNRAIAEHALNASSTRSHCVFTIHVEVETEVEEEDGSVVRAKRRSKLHLVDLAGSERLGKTKSEGTVAKEAAHINKSLTFLEQVVIALVDQSKGVRWRAHVPYRSSKLTHMLKDSLGGNCRTVMLACIWPDLGDSHLSQTLSTLRFASRIRRVKNVVEKVSAVDLGRRFSTTTRVAGGGGQGRSEATAGSSLSVSSASASKMRREIALLRRELEMQDVISGKDEMGQNHRPLNEAQKQELARHVRKFVSLGPGKATIPFHNVRQIEHIFCEFRRLILDGMGEDAGNTEARAPGDDTTAASTSANTKPTTKSAGFAVFKAGEGLALNHALKEAKANLKKCKTTARTKRDAGNKAKARIDELLAVNTKLEQERESLETKLEYLQGNRPPRFDALDLDDDWGEAGDAVDANVGEDKQGHITDEERAVEARLGDLEARSSETIELLKEAKAKYRAAAKWMKEGKEQAAFLSKAVEHARERLVAAFDVWWEERNGGGGGVPPATASVMATATAVSTAPTATLPRGSAMEKVMYERVSRKVKQGKKDTMPAHQRRKKKVPAFS